MTVNDLAWLAGFFEGEGSVGCYRRRDKINGHINRSFSFNVSISQKDRAILEWIKRDFYGTISYMGHLSSLGTHIWRWDCRSSYARRFLEAVQPYLRTRRKLRQIKTAFSRMKKWRKHEKRTSTRSAYATKI